MLCTNTKPKYYKFQKKGFTVVSLKILEEDVAMLDDFVNAKATEGWELVTYSFTDANMYAKATGILVTLKKQK